MNCKAAVGRKSLRRLYFYEYPSIYYLIFEDIESQFEFLILRNYLPNHLLTLVGKYGKIKVSHNYILEHCCGRILW